MKSLKVLLLIALFAPLAADGHAAQPRTSEKSGSIHGKITEVRGYVMHGLTVVARKADTGQRFETVSDSKATFVFQQLVPGRYLIVSECPDIEPIIGSV